MTKRLLTILWLVLLSGMLSGCGIIDYFFLPPPEDTAQELYQSGVEALQAQDYGEAADLFTKLKDRYPFSPYAIPGEMALADALFLDESYEVAAEAYKEFASMHPAHDQIPYVLFQVGMSNYNVRSTIDRAQPHVVEALEYFYRVRDTYPDTPYGRNAQDYVELCRRRLADHELFIADFYWKAERYKSAWSRYNYVLDQFPDLPDVVRYALERSQMAYMLHQQEEAGAKREKEEGSWKQWFNWL